MSFTPGQDQHPQHTPPPQGRQPLPEWAQPAQPSAPQPGEQPQSAGQAPQPGGPAPHFGEQSQPVGGAPRPEGQPQPVWARPEQLQWQPTEPLEYHQLYRGAARYRWWKPLLTLILAVLYYLTLTVAFMFPVLIVFAISRGDALSFDDIAIFETLDTQSPWSVFVALASIALMIPAVWLAMLSTGLRPTGRGWSVALRIRWRWIWRTALISVVALIVMNVVGIGLEVAFAGLSGDDAAEPTGPEINAQLALISLLIVLLLVPLQATAEELVYRGLFMQTLGAWLGGVRGQNGFASFVRGPWIPILIPAILFGFSHIYDIWGFLQVTAMAIAAGWLSWRTGGLEAAISLHVVNNLVAFGFLAAGAGGETAQTENAGGIGSLIGLIVALAFYCWWVDRDFTRRDGRRTRVDYVQVRV